MPPRKRNPRKSAQSGSSEPVQQADGSSQAPDGPREAWWADEALGRQRLDDQLTMLLEQHDDVEVHRFDDGDLNYLCKAGEILVRDEDIARVRTVLDGGKVIDPLIAGISVLRVSRKYPTVKRAIARVNASLGVGIASPNYVYYVAPANVCPATEPMPAVPPLWPEPPTNDPALGWGENVLVAEVDTGFIKSLQNSLHPWLRGVTGDRDEYKPHQKPYPKIGPYVGHGTFVAGVLRSVAPNAAIHVNSVFVKAGAVAESKLVMALYRAAQAMPDVITMSAGTTTDDDLPPLGLTVLWEQRLRHLKGTVLVGAAGNNNQRRPFYPAAFPWAVAVGALDRHHNRTGYTDYGSWVDVYALGDGLKNAFPNGRYKYREAPMKGRKTFFTNEMAYWSGTSFATPLVSGMIAARMSQTGENGKQAAEAILAIARANAKPGVGPIADPSRPFM